MTRQTPCPSMPLIAVGSLLIVVLGAPAQLHAQEAPSQDTLFERLGGLPAISLVVSDFVDDFIVDDVILSNPAVRERKTPDTAPYIKFQVTTLVCQLAGGPCEYTGLDLATAHEGLNVTGEEWDRMVEIFAGTLAEHQVPEQEQEELFGIMAPARDDIVVEADRP